MEETEASAVGDAAGWRGPPRPAVQTLGARLARVEDGVSLVLLGLMTAIPLAEILARVFGTHVPGAITYVQVLTLWVGLAGALLATRADQHLALTAGSGQLGGRVAQVVVFVTTVVAAAVTAALAQGALTTVWADRASTSELAGGIPTWIPQLVLPLGYALMAVRLAFVRGKGFVRGAAVLAVAGLLLWGLSQADWEQAENWALPLVVGLVLTAGLGTPIYVILGGCALLLFWGEDVPIAAVSVETLRQLEEETLPVLPLFTFTGYILAESRASERLVAFFRGLCGWLPGGTAVMTAVVCAFFTTFTGASGVTILAIGGLLFPVLVKEHYPERFSTGLLTASGSIGLLFPPALPVILYGVVAGVPIDRLFVAGFVPGAVLVLAVAALGVATDLRTPAIERRPFSLRELAEGFRAARWELLVPVVAVGSYFSGLATLLESAALTAAYVLIVEMVIHRDLRLADLPRVGRESAALVGGVLVIFGVAMGLTNYLNDASVPATVLDWVVANVESKWVFLAALNLFLLAVGCLMDIFSALVVVVPLILPLGRHFGVDPIHLGVIFLANLELGFLTPPVGMNLFLSSYRFNRPLTEVYRTVLPFLAVLFLAVLVITYVPALTMVPVEMWFPPSMEAPEPVGFP